MERVRVRFAPSPTGHLHIGSLRTALFNWLFAHHHNGVYLIRMEDTDPVRSQPQFIDSILASLEWAGLNSDEPVVYQSQRMDEHTRLIEWLIKEGKVYRCYCPRTESTIGGDYLKYDGVCRTRQPSAADEGKPFVVRIKFPLEQKKIEFDDLIRGPISFDSDQFDDFIIARSDGTPVYNFVVVVDDAAMNITHVIRGEDHISNTPKQIILYQLLGFPIPKFAHIPLIMGESGKRLSKRDAATSVLDYKTNGYLAPALCNYLVRLGWAHGDQEIFTMDELISLFSLADIGKSAAVFDPAKLDWINSIYIRDTSTDILLERIVRDVAPDLVSQLTQWPEETLKRLISLFKQRVTTLAELATELIALHDQSTLPSEQELQKWVTLETDKQLQQLVNNLKKLSDFTADTISTVIKQESKTLDIKLSFLAQPLRLALLGKASGPGIFELMDILGKDETIGRIEQFIATLHPGKPT